MNKLAVLCVVAMFVAGCPPVTCEIDEDCPIGFVCGIGGSPPRCIDVEGDAAVGDASLDAGGFDAGGLDAGFDAGAFICIGPGDDDCTTDPFDPGNDGMGAASLITPGICHCGMGICTNDTDYYEFQLTATGGIFIALTFLQAEGDLDLSLFICRRAMGNCNGTALASAVSFTDNEVIHIPAPGLIPGRYILRVFSKFGFAHENPDYCLQVDAL